jgi:hypothetical protein
MSQNAKPGFFFGFSMSQNAKPGFFFGLGLRLGFGFLNFLLEFE